MLSGISGHQGLIRGGPSRSASQRTRPAGTSTPLPATYSYVGGAGRDLDGSSDDDDDDPPPPGGNGGANLGNSRSRRGLGNFLGKPLPDYLQAIFYGFGELMERQQRLYLEYMESQ